MKTFHIQMGVMKTYFALIAYLAVGWAASEQNLRRAFKNGVSVGETAAQYCGMKMGGAKNIKPSKIASDLASEFPAFALLKTNADHAAHAVFGGKTFLGYNYAPGSVDIIPKKKSSGGLGIAYYDHVKTGSITIDTHQSIPLFIIQNLVFELANANQAAKFKESHADCDVFTEEMCAGETYGVPGPSIAEIKRTLKPSNAKEWCAACREALEWESFEIARPTFNAMQATMGGCPDWAVTPFETLRSECHDFKCYLSEMTNTHYLAVLKALG